MRLQFLALLLFCVSTMTVLHASPSVGNVTYSQDQSSKLVKVAYVLSGEPGIPLLDICTNGVSIGWGNLRGAFGDVHHVVQNGSDTKTIYWNPDKHWPGHSLDSGVTAIVRVWPTDNPPDVMVVNCDKRYAGRPDCVQYFASYEHLPEGTVNCPAYKLAGKIAFRKIPAQGIVWRMGSPTSEIGRNATYEAQHKVKLTSNYYIGVFEVTQSQYERFNGSNPSYFKTDGEMRPVEAVGWLNLRGASSVWPGSTRSEAYASVENTSWIGKLREFAGGIKFDLPTEAQWEFACRAGSGASYPDGTDLSAAGDTSCEFLETHARYKHNSGADSSAAGNTLSTNDATAAVGTYLPNRWGLYDMHGNLLEWTLDFYAAYDTSVEVADNPRGATQDSSGTMVSRSTRGGSYLLAPSSDRSASRYSVKQNQGSRHVGFRLCLPLD